MDTRELAAAVMAAKGWDASDKALAVSVAKRLVHMLDEQSRRGGRFRKVGRRGRVNVWQAAEK